jgi:glycine dehydrogenase subunit 2
MIPPEFLREKCPALPEVSEADAARHLTRLSRMNHGVDSGFYPLGSCTMKYNPKINEDVSRYAGFTGAHPCQPAKTAQGCLEILYAMDKMLAEISGIERVSLQPAAGAHGEMAGLMIIKAYHEHRGDAKRRKILTPDSSHGTNPASAVAVGFDVVEIGSNERGGVDTDALRAAADDELAGLMLTNPNTLGLFEENILEIARIVHEAGGLLYYDGANMNAVMGIVRPGDMGFDVVHLNLHKTFGAPHGGGGPGSGPVGVKKDLVPFLPVPVIECDNGEYYPDYHRPLSVGRIKSFYGNFAVVLKAFAYIRSLGADGLREVSENAVLNANYIAALLRDDYHLPYGGACMHEVVFSDRNQAAFGVSALDIAKRLIDFGYHPPTIYFPLIVKGALMTEPVETESKETLDAFARAMKRIAREAETNPELLKEAPHNTAVSRPDEAMAARNPILKYGDRNES